MLHIFERVNKIISEDKQKYISTPATNGIVSHRSFHSWQWKRKYYRRKGQFSNVYSFCVLENLKRHLLTGKTKGPLEMCTSKCSRPVIGDFSQYSMAT